MIHKKKKKKKKKKSPDADKQSTSLLIKKKKRKRKAAFSHWADIFLPFWEETDCSSRAPTIATEKDMTAALRLPGIIFGDGRWKMPVGAR